MSGPIPVTSSPITFPSLTRKVPDLDENEWKKIDSELLTLQSPLHHLMGMDAIQSDEAMDKYTELLTQLQLRREKGRDKTSVDDIQKSQVRGDQ